LSTYTKSLQILHALSLLSDIIKVYIRRKTSKQ